MTKKKQDPTPIEDAIGERAKDRILDEKLTPEERRILNQRKSTPSTLKDAPDQPLTQNEMLSLEELNRRAVERFQDQYPEEPTTIVTPKSPTIKDVLKETIPIPVSKHDLPPQVTKTCTPESPPQKIEYFCVKCGVRFVYQSKLIAHKCPTPEDKIKIDNLIKETETSPAEDIELTALRKYILEDGFVVATVAFHIVSLCAQPMTTPSTTMWDFRDRASIPDMVLALLNQPGYLEGIWPSLRIVMSNNKGNAAWCAGIATTIAFFDIVRTLPALKELQNEENEKKS